MFRHIVRGAVFPALRSHTARRIEPCGASTLRQLSSENKQAAEQSTTQQHQAAPSTRGEDHTPGPESQTQVPGASAESKSQSSNIEDLTKKMQERDAQLAELNDRTLRALAEMENVRMIARRDVENARKYAIVPFAKAILSVADNLGLALGSVDKHQVEADDANPLLKGLYFGVGATESELLKVFSQYGISRFGSIGDKFDPNKYQAMFEAPSEEHEPGTVINVQKLGYEMGERILRPAEVGVSRAP